LKILPLACTAALASPLQAGDFAALYASTGGLEAPMFSLCWLEQRKGNLHPLWSSLFVTGIDASADERYLYGVSDKLHRLDLVGGARFTVGPLRLPGGSPILMSAVTIDASNRMVVCSNPTSDPAAIARLYEVDQETAIVTLIGPSPQTIFGLEFTDDGRLFAGFIDLLELDPRTGALIENHGSMGSGVFSIKDLDTGPDGLLRAVSTEIVILPEGQIGANTRIVRIDPEAPPGSLGLVESVIEGTDMYGLAQTTAPLVCVGDVDGDRIVGIADLLVLLLRWGPCPQCTVDFGGDGSVGLNDLLELLAGWGNCPG